MLIYKLRYKVEDYNLIIFNMNKGKAVQKKKLEEYSAE